ncbi:mitotic spindle checkpoint protein BUBR1 isoform X2 [Oryza brachyantha]|uniref:mitotic spindle checkpoint protein BUBR1 isoform X2 n=1 Tax=Oryza brachyantha TaxID=4533 RepID=UPI001ADA62B1|nr:mitotic spindle checkpoint protein BUBR1 isoform X2 [Oryza brachyantha]
MIEAIDEYRGEDPLQPWLDCIKWVQESFPTGGDCSGLVVIYEQCVRAFWHDGRYKDDLRYLKVWLEYAGNCADSEVIFRFLEANQIGQSHSIYYLSFASVMESKNKLKIANEVFNLGIARKAKPVEKLETTYRAFLQRLSKKKAHHEQDDTATEDQPARNFGTVLNRGEIRGQHAENSHLVKPRVTLQRIDANRPLAVYKDENTLPSHGLTRTRSNNTTWQTLGTQADRNKENNMRPAKWTSHKIPQKVGSMVAVQPTRASSIEVFVDDECVREPAPQPQVPRSTKPSILKLRQATSRNLKQETELLMENPLRNFPLTSLR